MGTGVRWEQRFSTAAAKRQKEWGKEVHRVAYTRLLATLAEEDQPEFRSAGGLGAGRQFPFTAVASRSFAAGRSFRDSYSQPHEG